MQHPTVYLDWSSLCLAFKATEGLAPADDSARRLRNIVETLAAAGSLCLSPVHLSELITWHPKQSALLMANWLDSLRATWVRRPDPFNDEELLWWIRHYLGLHQPPAYSPFASNLSHAFNSGMYPVSVVDIVQNTHNDHGTLDSKDHAVRELQRLHRDRSDLTSAFSLQDVARIGSEKFHAMLLLRASFLDIRDAAGKRLDNAELAAIVRQVASDEASVPFARLCSTLVHSLVPTILGQDPNSRRFQRRYASMSHDMMHLLGAAYCDVFTCDYLVDCAIDTFRERHGRHRQLSERACGGVAPFIQKIEAQIVN
jgi:hypothetical protein